MRTAVLTGPRCLEFRDVPLPDPGDRQVRVRVGGSGICGSNLPVWQGRPWFQYPLAPGAPGHEPWGEIDELGAGVSGFSIGDPVVFLCEQAFAEYATVDADRVVTLPASLAGRPFPGEPLACAVNVWRRARIGNGERVAVVGVGFLGALLVALARAAGAAHIVGISRRPSALEVASRMGATTTWRLDAAMPPDQIESFDCVIEAAGEQQTLDVASALVRERGRLVIAGYHQDGTRQVNVQSWNWRGLDVINAHERDPAVYVSGLREGVILTAAGLLKPSLLYSHLFRWDDLGRAFEMACTRPAGFMKALVCL